MRATRIANRWNLKSRAKAGRYLLTWQQRLNEGARNLYISGMQDALLQDNSHKPADISTQHIEAVIKADSALLEAASKERNEQPSLSPPPPPENAHSNGLQQGVDRSTSGGSLIISGEHL